MSYRERANRKAEAAAASVRFGEFMALVREHAMIQVCAPRMVAEAPERFGWDPLEVLQLEQSIQEQLADLAARIAPYRDDAQVMALARAELAIDGL